MQCVCCYCNIVEPQSADENPPFSLENKKRREEIDIKNSPVSPTTSLLVAFIFVATPLAKVFK